MKEVWANTQAVKDMKKDLAITENMVVNEDKLDQALMLAQNRLRNLEASFGSTQDRTQISSANRLTRPNRNIMEQTMRTVPRSISRNEEYGDMTAAKNDVFTRRKGSFPASSNM